ncbi:MAG TPA: hypothetical protein VFI91_06205 [Longimicrobiaceae bacterium]|nr:hypothetical protein [Longimicrobiaceae bacterium]
MTRRTAQLALPIMILLAGCGGPEKPPSPECPPGEECAGYEPGMTTGTIKELNDPVSPLEAAVDTLADTSRASR